MPWKRNLLGLVLVSLLLSGTALADSNRPTPGGREREGNPPQRVSAGEEQKAKGRGEYHPSPVKANDSPSGKVNTDHRQEQKKEKTSADWWMVYLTVGLLVVGIVQALIFVWQLRLLRNTVHDTAIAAGAARDSADYLRNAERAQLFVMPYMEKPSDPVEDWVKHFPLKCWIVLSNMGKTPAVLTNVTGGCRVKKNIPAERSRPEARGNVPYGVVIPSGQAIKLTLDKFKVSHADWRDILDGKSMLICQGVIGYKDIFNASQETWFCYNFERGAEDLFLSEEQDQNLNGRT